MAHAAQQPVEQVLFAGFVVDGGEIKQGFARIEVLIVVAPLRFQKGAERPVALPQVKNRAPQRGFVVCEMGPP